MSLIIALPDLRSHNLQLYILYFVLGNQISIDIKHIRAILFILLGDLCNILHIL
uniref:Uncharacterized protein n=1 Tax=Rhizophora mucronata TaxID=61149 RepID=A0A2P2P727_RHIMU